MNSWSCTCALDNPHSIAPPSYVCGSPVKLPSKTALGPCRSLVNMQGLFRAACCSHSLWPWTTQQLQDWTRLRRKFVWFCSDEAICSDRRPSRFRPPPMQASPAHASPTKSAAQQLARSEPDAAVPLPFLSSPMAVGF